MAPSVWSDADGRWRGPDDQVHAGTGFTIDDVARDRQHADLAVIGGHARLDIGGKVDRRETARLCIGGVARNLRDARAKGGGVAQLVDQASRQGGLRHIAVGGTGSGDQGQVLDDLLGVDGLTGAGLARDQHGLIVTLAQHVVVSVVRD